MLTEALLLERVNALLKEVKDPEIPTVSIIDMGMVEKVQVDEQRNVTVTMLPTFIGCPALEMIRQAVTKQLGTEEAINNVHVRFVLDEAWSSARINEEGRENLKKMGIAPPPKVFELGDDWIVECPYCDSPKTVIENVFGPTACRSILYCNSCKNPFEAIKPI